MFKLICVTNRLLCDDFITRIKKIASADVDAIILREKDLSAKDYENLAIQAINICNNKKIILHNFTDVALKLNFKRLHLPLFKLRELKASDKSFFEELGASCHSVKDAKEAEKLGCTYITAGHIYDTDCKKGLSGRGVNFLKEICDAVNIPVYAIGGITPEKISELKSARAVGACVMSGFMRCEKVEDFVSKWR